MYQKFRNLVLGRARASPPAMMKMRCDPSIALLGLPRPGPILSQPSVLLGEMLVQHPDFMTLLLLSLNLDYGQLTETHPLCDNLGGSSSVTLREHSQADSAPSCFLLRRSRFVLFCSTSRRQNHEA